MIIYGDSKVFQYGFISYYYRLSLKETVIFVMSMGNYFLNTHPIYFGQLIGSCRQIIEHDINYSLRYLEGQNLHSDAVKTDEILHLYYRNRFQLNVKTQYNLNKNFENGTDNLNFLISTEHLFYWTLMSFKKCVENVLFISNHMDRALKKIPRTFQMKGRNHCKRA